ncbi:MAG: major facilitator superfamily 1 [Deltaproteobacteria bacterium]|nr:major facilitator superfamily 1 [Deltaproteobacteria bacterium]
MKARTKTLLQSPHVWAFTTYFAEGFPYTIIRIVSSVFFRDMKVSLEAIGLTSLFGIPWVIKFLWGPQIDGYATKRGWMLSLQFLLGIMAIGVAFLTAAPSGIKIVALLLFIGSFIAATHDMAIDGYYMEALDEAGQAKFVGYRVMAYRIAMMTGTGVVVTLGATLGWFASYLASGALLFLLTFYHFTFLPKAEKEKKPLRDLLKVFFDGKFAVILLMVVLLIVGIFLFREEIQKAVAGIPLLVRISFSGWIGIGLVLALVVLAAFGKKIKGRLLGDRESFYARAFMTYMDRDRMAVVLAFIILMRTGESMLSSMASPFMVDLGIKVHYGWISGGVGLPFSILGAMAGGWLISKYSLGRTVWPFLLAQNLTNLVYMALALSLGPYLVLNTGAQEITPIGSGNLFFVALVHAFDQFAGGLGTSVLVTFLMRTCLPDFKAAHFAVGTGLMNLSGVLAGVAGGFLAEGLGYGYFFGISFLASIPGMALIPLVPFLETKRGSEPVPLD